VSSVQNSGNLAGPLERQVTELHTSQSAWTLSAFLAGLSPEENILTNLERRGLQKLFLSSCQTAWTNMADQEGLGADHGI